MFSLDQKLTLESFHRHLLVVFWQNKVFWSKWGFFSEIPIFAGSVEIKKKTISDNVVHNIFEFYNVLRQTQLTTSKTKRDI